MSVCPPYLAAGVLGEQSAPGRIPYLRGFGMNLVLPLIPQHPTLIGAKLPKKPTGTQGWGLTFEFAISGLILKLGRAWAR